MGSESHSRSSSRRHKSSRSSKSRHRKSKSQHRSSSSRRSRHHRKKSSKSKYRSSRHKRDRRHKYGRSKHRHRRGGSDSYTESSSEYDSDMSSEFGTSSDERPKKDNTQEIKSEKATI